MQVAKVINNNIVSTINGSGTEMVLMGCGLGFRAKVGAVIDESKVEKTFILDGDKSSSNFSKLLDNLPVEHVQVAMLIIEYASAILPNKLNGNLFLTLTDHISFAISRAKDESCLSSVLMNEVRAFYPKEYAIGCYALAIIKDKLGIELDSGEACAIALHITNAEYSTKISEIANITHIIAEVSEKVLRSINIELSQEDYSYNEFMAFLKYFVFRLFSNGGMIDYEDDLFNSLCKSNIEKIYSISDDICLFLEEKMMKKISKMDRSFLAINLYWLKEYNSRRSKYGSF